MFSKIKINETTQIALAPISVLPKFQKQGIGGMLIKEGHKIAKELGFEFSVVLGDPLYYTKFGYIPAYNFKIKPPFNINTEYYMAINLQGKTTILDGIVKYSKEFFE